MTNHVPLAKDQHVNLRVIESGDYTRFKMRSRRLAQAGLLVMVVGVAAVIRSSTVDTPPSGPHVRQVLYGSS